MVAGTSGFAESLSLSRHPQWPLLGSRGGSTFLRQGERREEEVKGRKKPFRHVCVAGCKPTMRYVYVYACEREREKGRGGRKRKNGLSKHFSFIFWSLELAGSLKWPTPCEPSAFPLAFRRGNSSKVKKE